MTWNKRGTASTLKEVFLDGINAESLEDVNNWFRLSNANGYSIKGITDAVKLCNEFRNKPVTIIGDYDADGVNSTAILNLALRWSGFTDVKYRIPKRFSEGFGINPTIIEEIKEGLIITCDNGIAQIDTIKLAKDKGLTVIIIDHHQPVYENEEVILPPADVIINPNAIPDSAVFNGYCGAGLCYKFAKELLTEEKKNYFSPLLTLAAIATIGDVMDLREENYVFVRKGIQLMKNPQCCTQGLNALLGGLFLRDHISSTDIGFKVAPTMNAASRMKDDGAQDVVDLLSGDYSYYEAVEKANKLIELNNQRKELKKIAVEAAEKLIAEQGLASDVPIVLHVPDISEGIIGIVAGVIAEKYKAPTIIFSDSTVNGVYKGSARAPEGYNMSEELGKHASLLLKFGGHEGAAGLSIRSDCLEELRNKMKETSSFLPESVEEQYYDLEIEVSEIPAVIEELEKYAPYGKGNPEPVFRIKGFRPVQKRFLGSAQDIVKMQSKYSNAIGFGVADSIRNIPETAEMELLGTVAHNYFNRSVENQITFTDFVLVE